MAGDTVPASSVSGGMCVTARARGHGSARVAGQTDTAAAAAACTLWMHPHPCHPCQSCSCSALPGPRCALPAQSRPPCRPSAARPSWLTPAAHWRARGRHARHCWSADRTGLLQEVGGEKAEGQAGARQWSCGQQSQALCSALPLRLCRPKSLPPPTAARTCNLLRGSE